MIPQRVPVLLKLALEEQLAREAMA